MIIDAFQERGYEEGEKKVTARLSEEELPPQRAHDAPHIAEQPQERKKPFAEGGVVVEIEVKCAAKINQNLEVFTVPPPKISGNKLWFAGPQIVPPSHLSSFS